MAGVKTPSAIIYAKCTLKAVIRLSMPRKSSQALEMRLAAGGISEPPWVFVLLGVAASV